MSLDEIIGNLKAKRDRLQQQAYKVAVELAQWERMKEREVQPRGYLRLSPWDELSIRAQNCALNEGLVTDHDGTPDLKRLASYDINKLHKLIPNCGVKTAEELKEWAVAVLPKEKAR